ncbi:hypothetical protein BCh11DRAFT_04144 [Burkholderia sp. Ch1-1]|uniref:Uncharacterized protein n=1 Tax=Paraburkholderia phytofirmans OLGA172 TaxID=1417228 RepID=A0A160FGF2_9BURK|nr:hypothetical protein [Paraburkholderia phytofirmans]ANB71150.1 hypothetical protein AYM40_01335 [Paraburkholderia phytofirmans OLGA172]EIF28724.1 hypothetical protein BCh11DRAFT_04144 [Burkholderia sp. Ch1-1]
MTTPLSKGAKRSDSTRALIQERALERGAQRTEDVQQRVRMLMADIEDEMARNEGIYPHNGGALSGAEIARRAGIHPTTLFSPKQRDFGSEVKQWLERIKEGKVVGRGPVRRELADRIADWKALYDGLAQSHRDTELELQQTEADLEKARGEIKTLQATVDRLTEQLAALGGEKVVSLRNKGK